MEAGGNTNEVNEVYLKLDNLFKVRLAAQIKGSGLHFERLLYATDLISGDKYYTLLISSEIIFFNEIGELYRRLIEVIEKELNKIRDEINNYQYKLTTDLKSDKAFIQSELDGLGYREDKLYKVIAQIEKYLEVK